MPVRRSITSFRKLLRGSLVVGLVADETQLVEEIRVEGDDLGVAVGVDVVGRVGGRHRDREPAARFVAEKVELREIAAGVELGILDARDHQRRDGEIGIRAQRRVREASNETGGIMVTGNRIAQKKGRGRTPRP